MEKELTEGFLRASYKHKECACREALRAHFGDGIVFTGTWAETAGERELEEEELLEGEISASVFTVGCYAVRIAECLYGDDGSPVRCRDRIPTGQDKTARHRKGRRRTGQADAAGFSAVGLISQMGEGARKVTEVSARYHSGSEASADCWRNICMAAHSAAWSEGIDYICTVKRNDAVPNGQAVLFVLKQYTGSSHSVEQWYKFTPDGKVEEYCISRYGQQSGKAAWKL